MIGDQDQSLPHPKPGQSHRTRWTNRPVRRERPTGVTIIAAWHFVSAVTSIATALFTFNAASRGGFLTDTGMMAGAAWLYLLIAPISLALGVGLWLLARWAWVLTLSFAILSLIFTFFDGSLSGADFFGALFSAGIVYYLVQPSTREAFGISPT